jgi:RHS repeat-associated protein
VPCIRIGFDGSAVRGVKAQVGAQQTLTDATGTRTFTYTAALRPDQELLPAFFGDRILTRSYQGSATGEVPGRSDGFELGIPGDLDQDYSVVYAYDSAGRLRQVSAPHGNYDYTYTANSVLLATRSSPVHLSTYGYETHRDVLATLANTVGSATVSRFDYTVNKLGQRTQRANTGTAFAATSTESFGYNAKGELAQVTNPALPARDQSFAYDDIGNRLGFTNPGGTTSYTANSLNQYTQVSGFSSQPSYDADGNQTATGLGQAYVWDAENRLISVEPILPLDGDQKVLNTYDGQSRRVRRQVFSYASGAWSLTTDEKYIYDGWNPIARYDAQASGLSPQLSYTWGLNLSGSFQGAGGVGGLLAVKDGANAYHYSYDANGNVSEVLNNSGAVVAHYEYTPFGDTYTATGSYAAVNEYRFSTKPLDAASGLYYYGFRYYNPSTGRWLSRDPVEEGGGLNVYGFVENDPVLNIDLLGQKIPWKRLINVNYTYTIPLFNPYINNITITLTGNDLIGCCFRVQLTGTASRTLNLSKLYPAAKDLVTAEVGITAGGSIRVCLGSNGDYSPVGDVEGLFSVFGSGSIGAGSKTTSRGKFQDFGGYGTPFPSGSSRWKANSDNGVFGSVSIHGDIVYNFSTESLNRRKTGVFVDASFGYRFRRHTGSWSTPSKKLIPWWE